MPLDIEKIIQAIYKRQGEPWNNGNTSENPDYDILQKLYEYINSGIPREDYFFQGDIYRIHCPKSTLAKRIDKKECFIIGKICNDGSCSTLPITRYSNRISSFSRIGDFTNRSVYTAEKVPKHRQSIMFHCNTKDKYGIDINAFLKRYDRVNERFIGEQEILFPLSKEFVIKEYKCSPTQFDYYLRNYKGEHT